MKNIIIRVLAQVEGVKDKKRCLANLTILKTSISNIPNNEVNLNQ